MGTYQQFAIRPVRRDTKEFARALDTADNIKCYSLDSYFIGKELRDDDPSLIMSPRQWLRQELYRKDHAKLLNESGTNRYKVRVHSNLWYEFEADTLTT